MADRNEACLKLAAIGFALTWTLLMIWWTETPIEPVPVLIFLAAGGLAGVLWYWLYGKWFRWYFAARTIPRSGDRLSDRIMREQDRS